MAKAGIHPNMTTGKCIKVWEHGGKSREGDIRMVERAGDHLPMIRVDNWKGAFDYINANNVEYIPNIPHKWLVLENNETINGWTRPSGTSDVRCYFSTWGTPQSDWPKDYPEYAGSSICTTQDFVNVLQANQDSFVVKPRRLLLQNEPWVGAVQPKSGVELADFYKNDLEPALAIVPMDVVLHTSKKSDKCLLVDIDFLKRCDDIGCNFDLATEWSLHHHSQET